MQVNKTDLIEGWSQAGAAHKVVLSRGFLLVRPGAAMFGGYSGRVRVRLGSECNLDVQTRSSAHVQLVFQDSLDDHRVSLIDGVVCLTHATRCLTVRMHPGSGVRELCFSDGVVSLNAGYRRALLAQAQPGAGRVEMDMGRFAHLIGGDVHTRQVGSKKAIPCGSLMEVTSRDGVDTVYNADPLVSTTLEGRFVDFSCSLNGQVISLARRDQARRHVVHVLGEGSLVFSDGRSSSEALRGFLRGESLGDHQTHRDGALRITAVALSVGSGDAIADTFDEQGASGDGDRLVEGQVLEAVVSFRTPILVVGTPAIEMVLGQVRRLGSYAGGSGSDTLRFTYTVVAEDVQAVTVAQTGTEHPSALRFGDVEVGRLATNSAVLLEVIGEAVDNKAEYAIVQRPDDAIHVSADFNFLGNGIDIDLNELEADASGWPALRAYDAMAVKPSVRARGASHSLRNAPMLFNPLDFLATTSMTSY